MTHQKVVSGCSQNDFQKRDWKLTAAYYHTWYIDESCIQGMSPGLLQQFWWSELKLALSCSLTLPVMLCVVVGAWGDIIGNDRVRWCWHSSWRLQGLTCVYHQANRRCPCSQNWAVAAWRYLTIHSRHMLGREKSPGGGGVAEISFIQWYSAAATDTGRPQHSWSWFVTALAVVDVNSEVSPSI